METEKELRREIELLRGQLHATMSIAIALLHANPAVGHAMDIMDAPSRFLPFRMSDTAVQEAEKTLALILHDLLPLSLDSSPDSC